VGSVTALHRAMKKTGQVTLTSAIRCWIITGKYVYVYVYVYMHIIYIHMYMIYILCINICIYILSYSALTMATPFGWDQKTFNV
jgi:hypothetical protein